MPAAAPAAAADGEAATEPTVTPEYQTACESFVVVGQDVEIDINFRDKSVSGVSTLLIFPLVDDLEEVSIDARQCRIDADNILVDGTRTRAWYSDPYDLAGVPDEWQLGAAQHQVMKRRMAPLLAPRRSDVPISQRDRLMQHGLGCVPNEGSLKVSLRPADPSKGERRQTLKLRPADKEPDDERHGIKISVPFRSSRICDGLHFAGVDEGDTRYPHVYTRHSVEPGTASCIFPCIDDPGQRHLFKVSIKCPRTLGDALEQPLATQQASVPATDGVRKREHGERGPQQPHSVLIEEDKLLEMTVICSGNLTGEHVDADDDRKKVMSFECQNAAACSIGFVVGPFEHVPLWSEFRTEESDEKLGANAAKVHGYCLPGRADEVRNTCAPIVSAADYFALEFGRYPFDSYKMCFVEDLILDTVEAASLSLCSTRLLYPRDIVDTEIDTTRKLVHSLASQYLGVHIVPNKRSDRWLVAGIQWYMTDLFMKTLCGTNWYKFHLKTLSDKLVETDVGRPSLRDLGEHLHLGHFEVDFMALKAPLVLFILDQRMSKYPGSIGLARVVSQMVSAANISNTEAETTAVSAETFRKSCEKRSQYRSEAFWDQWVHGSGCPKLLIKQRFNKKNLNVELVATQVQGHPSFNRPRPLEKDDFWREFQEEIHHVYAGEVQKLFTGPFTVRIHEADGTPYEHYLDIREDDKNGTTWWIPYNTKYKRLKRKGRQKDPAASASANLEGKNEMQDDDVVYFNMFGDVLLSDEDMKNWGLKDWDPDVQNMMDQESYEWIRFDCNFEWLCDIVSDMPGYMYLAQLQQDRDVVAHQDAMVFWTRSQRHPVGSSIEVRTLYDRRYYHGVRTMAVEDLPKQAVTDQNYIGMAHLILAFRYFFCYRVLGSSGNETWPPAPNDFSDKAQYAIQSSIPGAIARVRGEKGRCPRSARSFLLDLLLFNDNSSNDFSDQFYIANLLTALTTSLVVDNYDGDRELVLALQAGDDEDLELKQFIEKTIEEIDRFRRMDEWTCSYHNVWTTTALECKMRLMRARVIPRTPLEFLQYLQDENTDLVRIKAFECLVELGMISRPPIMKLLVAVMSTDGSPFVRDRLFRLFCRGVASIAFAEDKVVDKPAPPPDMDLDDGGLIIEQGEEITEARKAKQARREDITAALAGLKEEVRGNTDLQIGLWRAFQSTALNLGEKRQVLDLCQAMFEPEDALLLTFKYPKVWRAARAPKVAGAVGEKPGKKSCIVNFTSHYRTTPRTAPALSASASAALPPEAKPAEPKKIKLQSRPSFGGPPGSNGTPPPLARQPSISVIPPRPLADSIAVQPVARRPVPATSPLPAQRVGGQQPIAVKSAEKRPKPPKKRRSDDAENSERPRKQSKTDAAGAARRRLVRLRFDSWDRLRPDTRRRIEAEKGAKAASASTIVATPSRGPYVAQLASASSHGNAHRPSTPTVPRHAISAPGSSKPRKPLPSAAPHQPPAVLGATPPPGAAATAQPSATHSSITAAPSTPGTPPAASRPKTIIRLKLPSARRDPSPQPPQP